MPSRWSHVPWGQAGHRRLEGGLLSESRFFCAGKKKAQRFNIYSLNACKCQLFSLNYDYSKGETLGIPVYLTSELEL